MVRRDDAAVLTDARRAVLVARGALRAVKLERERMPARVRALYDYDAEIDRAERVYDAALALLVTLDPAGDYAEFGLA